MYFVATSFQELIEIMVSCDRLGLMYVVQKDFQEFEKWFGIKREFRPLWKLQVVQYVEEVEENEGEEISHRRQSESEEERPIDVESEYYLEKFAGRVGQLFDVTRSSRGVPSFHVNFGNEIGIFHENEIEYVTD